MIVLELDLEIGYAESMMPEGCSGFESPVADRVSFQ
jgi:hypothetical protein